MPDSHLRPSSQVQECVWLQTIGVTAANPTETSRDGSNRGVLPSILSPSGRMFPAPHLLQRPAQPRGALAFPHSVPVLSLRPFFLCGMVSSRRPLSEICLPSIDCHPSPPTPQGASPPLLQGHWFGGGLPGVHVWLLRTAYSPRLRIFLGVWDVRPKQGQPD